LKTQHEAETQGGEAGKPYDHCYHKPCDNIRNINQKLLGELSQAGAHAAYSLAMDE